MKGILVARIHQKYGNASPSVWNFHLVSPALPVARVLDTIAILPPLFTENTYSGRLDSFRSPFVFPLHPVKWNTESIHNDIYLNRLRISTRPWNAHFPRRFSLFKIALLKIFLRKSRKFSARNFQHFAFYMLH